MLRVAWNDTSEPRTQRSGVSGPLSTATPLTPLRCVRGSDKCVKPDRARYTFAFDRFDRHSLSFPRAPPWFTFFSCLPAAEPFH